MAHENNRFPITRHRISGGFTIVELLVVIVVIGILAAITVVSYNGIQARAHDTSVLSDIDTLDALETNYGLKNNVAGKAWYSGNAVDSDLQFVPSSGNVIDVVTNGTDYCIRGYNTQSSKTSIYDTFYEGSSPNACSQPSLGPSVAALAANPRTFTMSAITGTTQVGQILASGALNPSNAVVNYQWQNSNTSNGTYTNIIGATSPTYTIASSDVGKYIKVVSTGNGGYTGTITSDASAVITAGTFTMATITGTTQVGQILTAGALTPTAATVTYQWQSSATSNGTYTNIAGATSSTYTLVSGDSGRYIKLVATANGGYTGIVNSNASAVVTSVVTATQVAVVIVAGGGGGGGGAGDCGSGPDGPNGNNSSIYHVVTNSTYRATFGTGGTGGYDNCSNSFSGNPGVNGTGIGLGGANLTGWTTISAANGGAGGANEFGGAGGNGGSGARLSGNLAGLAAGQQITITVGNGGDSVAAGGNGENGGNGYVTISYPTGAMNPSVTNGSQSAAGGNTIFTYSINGTFIVQY